MARDKVKRNVVELTEVPAGRPGRKSKSLSAEQADEVLTKTAPDRLHAYKTRKSRRTLAVSGLCADALRAQRVQQAKDRLAAGERWTETGIVFNTRLGTGMDPANVRRDLRRALALVPGLNPADWTPRELRHSFVSLLSDAGVPLEDIAQLVGHSGTTVTELVYRHQIRPVIQTGATVMDRLFGHGGSGA